MTATSQGLTAEARIPLGDGTPDVLNLSIAWHHDDGVSDYYHYRAVCRGEFLADGTDLSIAIPHTPQWVLGVFAGYLAHDAEHYAYGHAYGTSDECYGDHYVAVDSHEHAELLYLVADELDLYQAGEVKS